MKRMSPAQEAELIAWWFSPRTTKAKAKELGMCQGTLLNHLDRLLGRPVDRKAQRKATRYMRELRKARETMTEARH